MKLAGLLLQQEKARLKRILAKNISNVFLKAFL